VITCRDDLGAFFSSQASRFMIHFHDLAHGHALTRQSILIGALLKCFFHGDLVGAPLAIYREGLFHQHFEH
jgi:hypothetical protein